MSMSALSRRRFIQLSGALPVSVALARPAFAAASGAALPNPGLMDVPANLVLINGNEYPSGPTPAALKALNAVAANGNRYYMAETTKFTGELAAYHGLKPGYATIYAGSSEPLRFTTMAFTGPAKSLVTADPTFESAWRAADAMGAKVHKVPLKADFSYDVKAMVAADPNAGLIYICNPNNPTGAIVKRSDIEWVLENKPKGAVVLVDEAYIHFSDAESVIDLVAKDKDLVVIRTFSKIYSMGGLRFGYALARPDLMEKLLHYGVNSMATTAIQCAKTMLFDKDLVPLRKKANADARDMTFEFLSKQGYAFSPSQANHFLVDMKRDGRLAAASFANKSVIIGRSWASMPTWSRVSVGSMKEMESFQTAFVDVMKDPAGKVNAMAHPYPHLENAFRC